MVLRFMLLCAVLVAVVAPPGISAEVLKSDRCSDYSHWEWAQTIYDWQPSVRNGLDPDGIGIACENLPRGGAVPAWWTDTIPDEVEEAMVLSVVAGDTLEVFVDGGVEETLRLYRANTPELAGCGGEEATDFVRDLLSRNDEGLTVWLESDATPRDRYDRKLAYVWFTIDGRPYMLNEVLVRSGWAQDVDYGDRLYENQMGIARNFAEKWQLGQYDLCGGFNAWNLADSSAPLSDIEQEGPGAYECDPSYPTVCIPPIEVTGDLDCGQIEFRNFVVLPPDPHRFDGDKNGEGCERP